MKKIKRFETKLEKKLVHYSVGFFTITVLVGFVAGFFQLRQQKQITHELRRQQEIYKQNMMAQLNYQIRYND